MPGIRRITATSTVLPFVLSLAGCPASLQETDSVGVKFIEHYSSGSPELDREHAKSIEMWIFPGRDKDYFTKSTFEKLDVKPGLHILDVGAGPGFHTFKLAEMVGPQGHVYASDIDRYWMGFLDWNAKMLGLGNITPIHVRPEDLGVGDDSVDRILIVSELFFKGEQEKAHAYYRKCADVLREGGLMLILYMNGLASLEENQGPSRFYLTFNEQMKALEGLFSAEFVEKYPENGNGYLLVLRENLRPSGQGDFGAD